MKLNRNFLTYKDAKTAIDNSGFIDWDWGEDEDGDPLEILDQLVDFVYRRGGEFETEKDLMISFIVEVLDQNPYDYISANED